MRIVTPHVSRRGAFFFIALFSCLQIFLGFFLITGNGHESVVSSDMRSPPPSLASPSDDTLQKTKPQKLAQFLTIKPYENP